MYAHFYHLSENPFNLTPDPKFHYINESTREALAAILYGIKSRKGFLTLIGEAGTGKTTLLRRVVDDIEGETRVVFVFNPGVSFDELLEYLCMELGIRAEARGRLHLLERLNAFLLQQLTEGRNVVVIIDEAQTLADEVLEELRLLSNLETSKEKILQIVLSGQPELEEKLRRPNLRQLRQRIGVRATLKPMRADEIRAYVETRLRTAGGQKVELFTNPALVRCWQASQGIPRVINVICDNAMMIAFAEGADRISVAVMNAAIRDLDGQTPSEAAWRTVRDTLSMPAVRYGAIGVAVLAASFVWGRGGFSLPRFSPAPLEVARERPREAIAPSASPEGTERTRKHRLRRDRVETGVDAPAAVVVEPAVETPPAEALAAGEPEANRLPVAGVAGAPVPPEPTLPAGAPPSASPAGGVGPAVSPAAPGSAVMAPPLAAAPSMAGVPPAASSAPVVANVPAAAAPATPPSAPAPVAPATPPSAPEPAAPLADVMTGSVRRAEMMARSAAARLYGGEVEVPEGPTVSVPPPEERAAPALRGRSEAEALAEEAMRAPVAPLEQAAPPSMAAPPPGLAGGLESVASLRGATAPAPRRLSGPPPVGRHVRVARGDTVWAIAMQHYGTVNSAALTEIFRHNPKIKSAHQLDVGSDVFVPFLGAEQMVSAAGGGGYQVLLAETTDPKQVERASAWAAAKVPGHQLRTVTKGKGGAVRMVYATGFSDRSSALQAAKSLLGTAR